MNTKDDDLGNYRPVLQARNGRLYLPEITSELSKPAREPPLEILPKVDLADGECGEHSEENQTRLFSICLRSWRGFKSQAEFNETQY